MPCISKFLVRKMLRDCKLLSPDDKFRAATISRPRPQSAPPITPLNFFSEPLFSTPRKSNYSLKCTVAYPQNCPVDLGDKSLGVRMVSIFEAEHDCSRRADIAQTQSCDKSVLGLLGAMDGDTKSRLLNPTLIPLPRGMILR